VQSGLPFQVFPQALTVNGFTGAVMGATFGPAVVGEALRRTLAENVVLLSAGLTHSNPAAACMSPGELCSMVQRQALVVSMKEIYGWLLLTALLSLLLIMVRHSLVRPFAVFPKWSTVRRVIKHLVRTSGSAALP